MKTVSKAPIQRYIVMLKVDIDAPASRTRQTAGERWAAIDAVVQKASEALPAIDEIISRHGGRRISDSPDALGGVVIETTQAGAEALRALDSVVEGVVADRKVELI